MQFWQCSISLQFLQIITANDFAFGSLQNLQLLTSADCSVSLHAMVHCNSKCIAVIPLQFHCNFPAIVCRVPKVKVPNYTERGLWHQLSLHPTLISALYKSSKDKIGQRGYKEGATRVWLKSKTIQYATSAPLLSNFFMTKSFFFQDV